MRKAITELRKVYRAGANIFLNPFSAPVQERAYPVEGDLKLDAKIYSPRDLEELFKHISTNAGVSSLSLRDNVLTSKHAEIIAHYLEKTGIRNLNLSQNQLGDEGAQVLAGSISKLRGLDLSFNGIGLLGSKALLGALKGNKSMQTFFFSGNNPTGSDHDLFYRSLSDVIGENTRLQYLSFEPVLIAPSNQNLEELKKASRGSPMLEEILLRERVGYPASRGSWHSDPRDASPDYAPKISLQGSQLGSLAGDAIKDYSTILLVRMIRKVIAENPSATMRNLDIDYLEEAARAQTQEILLRGMSSDEIEKFSEIWHSPFRQAQSQKLRDYGNESWQRLLGEKTFPVPVDVAKEAGWELVCLENAQELKDEGSALNHCVGGYASKCISGGSNIFSLRKNGKPLSTIEIVTNRGKASIKQHYGYGNSRPEKSQSEIASWFVESINDRAFKIAEVDAEKRNKSLISRIGFDSFDDNKFREILSKFRNTILPSGELEIPTLTNNFEKGLLGEVAFDDGKFGYPRGLKVQSLVTEDRSAEDNLKVKVRGAIQTSLDRIFGKDQSGNSLAKSSLIDGELFIFTNKTLSADLKSILGNHVEERLDGLGITGNVKEVRESLTRKAFEIREAQKLEKQKQKKEKRSKDESDLEIPRSIVENPALESRDDNDLNRAR